MGEYGNTVTFNAGGTLRGGSALTDRVDQKGILNCIFSGSFEPYRMCIVDTHNPIGSKELNVYNAVGAVSGKKEFHDTFDASTIMLFAPFADSTNKTNDIVNQTIDGFITGDLINYKYSILNGKWEAQDNTLLPASKSFTFGESNIEYLNGLKYVRFALNDSFWGLSFGIGNANFYDSENSANWATLINLPIFSSLEKGVQFVNGLIDEDEADVPPHDFDADENKENDNNDDSSSYEQNPFNTPQVDPTMIKGASNYYTVTTANVNAFVNWLWNDLIKEGSLSDWLLDSITKINGNLYQCITGLRLFPCNIKKHLASVEAVPIVLGRFNAGFEVLDGARMNPKISEIEYKIPTNFDNFLDYPPYTTALIYLPFVGFSQFDLTIFQPGKKMKIETYIDITTGVVDYALFIETEDGYAFIEHHSGTCAVEIPMAYDNASNWLQNFVGDSIKDSVITLSAKGATALSANIEDKEQALEKTIKTDKGLTVTGNMLDSFDTPTNYNVGSPSPKNGLYFPTRAQIVFKRPVYQRPSTYSKNVGYPCMKSLKAKDLSGYTTFLNPQIEYGNTTNSDGNTVLPTLEEMEMIYKDLSSGVYL